jgi:hypothetical protein
MVPSILNPFRLVWAYRIQITVFQVRRVLGGFQGRGGLEDYNIR